MTAPIAQGGPGYQMVNQEPDFYPPGAYPQPGMSGAYQQPGMPGAYPQPGMPGAYPQPGMPGACQQPGMPQTAPIYPQVPLPPGAAVNWMPRPQPMPGVPIGLEYLTQLQGLLVKQETSLTEVVTNIDTNNKYIIMNSSGMQCYFAKEESDTCARVCCGPRRGFTFKILDNLGGEVMRITREFKCCGGCGILAYCCDCAAYEVTIESPVGQPIGYVKQTGTFWKARYNILDENQEPILKIEGPCCIMDGALCCGDNNFKLYTLDGTEIGKIAKKYAGFIRETASTADNFGMDFPLDLSVKAKASLLGALLLIDFMFFENASNQQRNNSFLG